MRESHGGVFKREIKRRVRRAGMERSEIELQNVRKVDSGKEVCGRYDVVDYV